MSRDLYNKKYFEASKPFQTDERRMEFFVDLIEKDNPQTVLDVGCGIGTLVRKLNEAGISTFGVDFSFDLKEYFWNGDSHFQVADAKRLPFADQYVDIVFSSDFFEHVEEDVIDTVANEMKRVGKKVIAFVAEDTGGALNQRQRQYHVTHRPLEWWINKLEGIEVHSSHI